MFFRDVIKLFEEGNVSVCGLRGRGKDMLMANVICRRNIPYVSNIDYGGPFIPFDFKNYDLNGNTYKDFINGTVKKYIYPYPDGTDVYLSDLGVYLPAQYCGELDRDYKNFPIMMCISRHLGFNIHYNAQTLSRVWNKVREQSDCFINCRKCIVLFGKIVIQRIRIYEKFEACEKNIPPFRVTAPLLSSLQTKTIVEMQKQMYYCTHGEIKSKILIYWNKSKYDTHHFKEVLKNGI